LPRPMMAILRLLIGPLPARNDAMGRHHTPGGAGLQSGKRPRRALVTAIACR
jgi:hypothetical protein